MSITKIHRLINIVNRCIAISYKTINMNIFFYFNHKINHVFFFFLLLWFREAKSRKKLPDKTLNFQYEILLKSHSYLIIIEREKLIRKQSGLSNRNILIISSILLWKANFWSTWHHIIPNTVAVLGKDVSRDQIFI